MDQEHGPGTQLQLIVQQWAQNVVLKEDIKRIKIASDLRKQVILRFFNYNMSLKTFRYSHLKEIEVTVMSQMMAGERKGKLQPIGQENGQTNPRFRMVAELKNFKITISIPRASAVHSCIFIAQRK